MTIACFHIGFHLLECELAAGLSLVVVRDGARDGVRADTYPVDMASPRLPAGIS